MERRVTSVCLGFAWFADRVRISFLFFFTHTQTHTHTSIKRQDFSPVSSSVESISDEDIEDKTYKDFLVEYLRVYPYTPMAQYRLGQHINTEHNGIQKRCQVEAIDSSLIHILFQVRRGRI